MVGVRHAAGDGAGRSLELAGAEVSADRNKAPAFATHQNLLCLKLSSGRFPLEYYFPGNIFQINNEPRALLLELRACRTSLLRHMSLIIIQGCSNQFYDSPGCTDFIKTKDGTYTDLM